MKKLSVIMMTLALVMGFTQCKKENSTQSNAPVIEGETYDITLTLSNGSNSKVEVYPDDDTQGVNGMGIAPVKFETGDSIWVVYNKRCVGALKCTSISETDDPVNGGLGIKLGVFTGSITVDIIGTGEQEQPLHFYFLGNKKPSESTTSNPYCLNSTTLTVDISDQTKELPVISYAPSKEKFKGTGKYSVQNDWLMNQCALVKFKMENIYDMSTNSMDNNPQAIYKTVNTITIYNMDNRVSVNLNEGSFNWVKTGSGAIILNRPDATQDSVRLAIVHHKDYSDVKEGALDVEFKSTDHYGFFGTYKIAQDVPMNGYCKDAKLDLVWHSGLMSIGSSSQVVFSRGNLQYANNAANNAITRPAGTWRFAKHQYDFVGGKRLSSQYGNVVEDETTTSETLSDNEQIADNKIGNYKGWLDLFGYGTGDKPTENSNRNSDYPSNDNFVDWGKNSISNSGKLGSNKWRTLTHDEWHYLIEERTNCYAKLGFATVAGIHGVIMLPDEWGGSVITPIVDMDLEMMNWTDNSYTASSWRTMEEYGAVFFPAAGWRGYDATTLDNTRFDPGTGSQNYGAYYSTYRAAAGVASMGLGYAISGSQKHVDADLYESPDNGHSVRLVSVHPTTGSSKFFNKKD